MRFFPQLLAPLLQRRSWCIWLAGASLLHVVMSSLSLPGFTCVFRTYTGLPCPGCGLTHATLALLHGQWSEAMKLHAFAPIFLVVLATIAVAAVLPDDRRLRLARAVEMIERQTAFGPIFVVALLVYWWLRLP